MRNFIKISMVFLLVLILVTPINAADQGLIKRSQINPGRLALQQAELEQFDAATKQLINQNFGKKVNESFSVRPTVKILNRVGKKFTAEAEIEFLAKNNYTAEVSKLEFDLENGKATLKKKTDKYVAVKKRILQPIAVSPTITQQKTALIRNVTLVPLVATPKALANTAYDTIPTAVSGTNNVGNIFQQFFGSTYTKIMVGSTSTKSAILNLLKNDANLLAWNNIGHGNTDRICQWESTIYDDDFLGNPAPAFNGIYHSVILLNSCLVCANPYNLRDAILSHNPRTYIGGALSLPIGRSELVDVDFWNKALLQTKAMSTALDEASASHGLAGYFCLNGHAGTFMSSK